MAASKDTVSQFVDLLEQIMVLDEFDYSHIPNEIRKITGNASVRATVMAIADELERRHPKWR